MSLTLYPGEASLCLKPELLMESYEVRAMKNRVHSLESIETFTTSNLKESLTDQWVNYSSFSKRNASNRERTEMFTLGTTFPPRTGGICYMNKSMADKETCLSAPDLTPFPQYTGNYELITCRKGGPDFTKFTFGAVASRIKLRRATYTNFLFSSKLIILSNKNSFI